MSEELADGEYEIPAEIKVNIASDEYSIATGDLPVTVEDGKLLGLKKSVAVFLRKMAEEVEKAG